MPRKNPRPKARKERAQKLQKLQKQNRHHGLLVPAKQANARYILAALGRILHG